MLIQNVGKMPNENKNFGAGDIITVHRGHTVEDGETYRIISVENLPDRTKALLLDRTVGRHEEGDLVENLSAQPDITIENCAFCFSNTHLRFQSRGKIRVRNCVSDLQFICTGDTNYWFESSPVTDIEIENVTFNVPNAIMSIPEFQASEKAPYYHKNISVRNCLFKNPFAVYARFADNITFTDNKAEAGIPVLTLDNCGSIHAQEVAQINRTNEKHNTDE